MDVHEALFKVGTVTPWSIILLLSLGFSTYFPAYSNFLAIIFIGLEPKHTCNLDNKSMSDALLVPGTCVINVYNQTHNYTLPCAGGWNYQQNPGESIVTEWDLVCDGAHLVSLSVSLGRAVAIIGELLCPMVIDYFGRKRTHIGLIIAFAALSVISAFSTSYIMFLVLRLIVGVFVLATAHSGQTLISELFTPRSRGFVSVLSQIPWTCSGMIVMLFAYFIRPWRYLHGVLSAIPFVWFLYIPFLPESPVWLVANNREKEAEDVLNLLAKGNKIRLDSPITLSSDDGVQQNELIEGRKTTTYRGSKWNRKRDAFKFLGLFKGRKVLRHTLIMSLLCLVNQLVFYGMMYNLPALSSNIYLSFFLMSVVEIPAYLSASWGVDRYGRKNMLIPFYIMVSVSLILLEIVPSRTSTGVDLGPLSLTLALFGKAAITGAFSVFVVYTPELFPTNLRGTAFGFVNVLGLIGGIMSPFMALLGKVLKWLPNVMFAVVSGCACLLVIFLPETNRRPLPITREEIRGWYGERDRKTNKTVHEK